MMKLRFLFPCLFAVAVSSVRADVVINERNFPDPAFRTYLLSTVEGVDSILSNREIEDRQTLDLSFKDIASLKGIKFFTSLRTLRCASARLTAVDVSGMTALAELDVSGQQVSSVDVSGCTCLESITVRLNKLTGDGMDRFIESLPRVDGGSLYALSDSPDEGNTLTAMQVVAARERGWTSYISDGSNEFLWEPVVEVDEETFPDENFRRFVRERYGERLSPQAIEKVTTLSVADKGIASLSGIECFTCLTALHVSGNRITELDLSKNKRLTYLSCQQNCIKGKAMDALVESLPDLSSTGSGVMLAVYGSDEQNVMTHTQVLAAKRKGWTPKQGAGGEWTNCEGTYEDIQIDERNFPDVAFRQWVLRQSYGSDGVLSSTEIPSIKAVDVAQEGIRSLQGIEHFAALTTLSAAGNELTSLDLSMLLSLQTLFCQQNNIGEWDMGLLVQSLPTLPAWQEGTLYVVYGNEDCNVMNTVQVAEAKARNWMPKQFDVEVGEWIDYSGSEPDGIEPITASPAEDGVWYDLSGRRLPEKPTRKGIYIYKAGGNATVVGVKGLP